MKVFLQLMKTTGVMMCKITMERRKINAQQKKIVVLRKQLMNTLNGLHVIVAKAGSILPALTLIMTQNSFYVKM